MKKKKVHLYLFADLFYCYTVVLHNAKSMSKIQTFIKYEATYTNTLLKADEKDSIYLPPLA